MLAGFTLAPVPFSFKVARMNCVASVFVRFWSKERGRPKPEIPFFGLSLLRNQTETLVTQTSAYTNKWMDEKNFGWLFGWVGGWLYAWLCVRINRYRIRPSRSMRTASEWNFTTVTWHDFYVFMPQVFNWTSPFLKISSRVKAFWKSRSS